MEHEIKVNHPTTLFTFSQIDNGSCYLVKGGDGTPFMKTTCQFQPYGLNLKTGMVMEMKHFLESAVVPINNPIVKGQQ